MTSEKGQRTKLEIWRRTKDWPDAVDKERVRGLYDSLVTDYEFVRFAVLFEEATGYAYGRKCTRFLSYADPTLRNTALQMLLLEKALVDEFTQGEHLSSGASDFPYLIDVRYNIAALILTVMNGTNPSLHRSMPFEVTARLVREIAREIPESPRWIVFPPIPDTMPLLQKYYSGTFADITEKEYEYLNVHEDMQIGLIATYATNKSERKGEIFNEAFKDFALQIGLKDFAKYNLPVHLFPERYEDPSDPCLHLVRRGEVKRYAKRIGVTFDTVALTEERLQTLRLKDLLTSFIPICYQLQDGRDPLFHAELSFVEANSVARLCHCLEQPREVVLRGFYKGKVFEECVYNILTGKDRVLVLQPEPFPAPVGLALTREERKGDQRQVQYSYRTPTRMGGRSISITSFDFPSFKPFLDRIGKSETDIDLVLINDGEPNHVLVGECKFTSRYNEDYYRKGLANIEALADHLAESDESRRVLELPEDHPIVPCLFVSYSGKIMRSDVRVLKVPLCLLLVGALKDLVSEHLKDAEG